MKISDDLEKNKVKNNEQAKCSEEEQKKVLDKESAVKSSVDVKNDDKPSVKSNEELNQKPSQKPNNESSVKTKDLEEVSRSQQIKSKIKKQFIKYFIANAGDNEQNKLNQKRFGVFIGAIVLILLLPVFYGITQKAEEQSVKLPDSQGFELQKLTEEGASYEDKWIKGARKEVNAEKEKADAIGSVIR